jgi:addiction module HigA family antidote
MEPIHPGEILQEDFLIPMKITAYKLAKETFLDQTRISEILKGKRSLTIDTALRLSKFFGTTPEFWINMQTQFDMEKKINEIAQELDKIHTIHNQAGPCGGKLLPLGRHFLKTETILSRTLARSKGLTI